MSEPRDLTGALFLQEDKENENWADFKGSCTIDGVEYWMDGWKKKGKESGKKFISLAFKPKQERKPAKPQGGGDDAWD